MSTLHFHITNVSSTLILGLQIQSEDTTSLPQHFTITRERGTLTLEPPYTVIPIGNLYPNESADLYWSTQENTDSFTLEDFKNLITIENLTDGIVYDTFPTEALYICQI